MDIEEALDILADGSAEKRERAMDALRLHPSISIPALLRIAGESDSPAAIPAEAVIGPFAVCVGVAAILAMVIGLDVGVGLIIGIPSLLVARWCEQVAPEWEATRFDAGGRKKARRQSARQVLDAWEDASAIEPICDSLAPTATRYFVPELQESLLVRLLPRLTESDRSLLLSRSRASLYGILQIENARQHGDLLIEILGAIERTGDTRAIPYVRALASAAVTTRKGQRVRSAAETCLPALKQRQLAEREGSILVRAADSPQAADRLLRPSGTSEDTLLQPVKSRNCSKSDTLLRGA